MTSNNALFRISAMLIILSISYTSDAQTESVPGVVVDHLPASGQVYIGSPGLCIMPDGSYIASHDFFGPGSTENGVAMTAIFRSHDKGKTWQKISLLRGQYWSNLFVLRGELYIMGTSKQYGNLVIRKSKDEGVTWSEPSDDKTGLIREGMYHTAPMPIIEFKGRLWRAIENAQSPPEAWGRRFRAMMFSVPADADLLNASAWKSTNMLPFDSTYLDGIFRGWLEGNAVVTPSGELIDMLRVATAEKGKDLAAIVKISDDGNNASFDSNDGFIDFTGGSKKFSIRYDEKSKRYWSVVNFITKEFSGRDGGSVRNTLVIESSSDLKKWTIHTILLRHPDVEKHGFQYVEWQFEEKDIIFLSRTAFDDGEGGAHNYHDANYLTFHRIKNFRKLSGKTIDPQ